MKCGKSSFKRALLWRNLTRFWPAWVGFGIVLILVVLNNSSNLLGRNFAPLWSLYGMLCGVLVMGYLFVSRYVNAIHSLPVRREGLLGVNLASGLLFLALPLAVAVAIASQDSRASDVAQWALVIGVLYLYGFSLSLLACVLTGTRLGAVTVWFLLAYGLPLLESALWYTLRPMLWGVYKEDGMTAILCPSVWVMALDFQSTFYQIYLACVAAASAALLGLTWWLYRHRKSEAAGDFVAFRWMQPVVKYVLTVILGLGLGLFFSQVIGSAGYNGTLGSALTWLLPGMLIARLVAEMLLSRSARVFQPKRLLSYALCLLVTAGVLLVTDLDVLGLETRIPDPAEVASVEIRPNSYGETPAPMDDPQAVQEVIEAHRMILERRNYPVGASTYQPVFLTYRLKNGTEFSREYGLEIPISQEDQPDSLYQRLNRLLNRPENLLAELAGWYPVTPEQVLENLADATIYKDGEPWDLGQADGRALLEAVLRDIQDEKLDQYLSSGGTGIELQFEIRQPGSNGTHYAWLTVPASAVRTLTLAEELLQEKPPVDG